ncbi:hypothetical protein C8J32_102300 [Rhizobium sp. PP-CC-3A-592]|nr:hypothetical protein C8J32_102300 [Rhizobium sp. PP-CC-3A-592]
MHGPMMQANPRPNGDAMSLQTTRLIFLHRLKANALGDALRRVQAVLVHLMRRRYPRLDLQSMPPHLQRDLGFLDGRDPRYEPAERR